MKQIIEFKLPMKIVGIEEVENEEVLDSMNIEKI